MRNIILIWNEVPENLKIYKFSVNDVDFEKLKLCHSKYINQHQHLSDVEAALNWLNEFLGQSDSKKYLIHNDQKPTLPIDITENVTIVVSGFLS